MVVHVVRGGLHSRGRFAQGKAAGCKSVVRRVQHRFNVSIAEVNNEDKWQRAQIGVSMVGDDWDHIQRQLQLVINFLDAEPRWEVVRVEMERY